MDNITRGDFGEGGRRLAARKKKKKKLLILLCVAIVAVAVFLSPVFNIRNIEVTGIKELTPEYVISSAGLSTGMHITSFSIKDAQKLLNKTPYISSAKINYVFPGSLHITVTEKMPVVYYRFADGYAGINVDGIVTDIVQIMEKKLPVASGITLASYSIGEKPDPGLTSTTQVDVLIEVAGALYNMDMSSEIAFINVSEITNITLQTANGLTVKCGDTSELEYKISALKEVLPHATSGGVADLSTPGQVIHTIN